MEVSRLQRKTLLKLKEVLILHTEWYKENYLIFVFHISRSTGRNSRSHARNFKISLSRSASDSRNKASQYGHLQFHGL